MKTTISKMMLLLCISAFLISCKKTKSDEPAVSKKRYILSVEYNNATGVASTKYYVNNTATVIGNPTTEKIYGEDLEVSGSDVYVLASRQQPSSSGYSAVIYKNGAELQAIPHVAGIYYNCLAVSGNDIYLAGYEYPNSGVPKIIQWKNGTVTSLTSNTGANATDARPFDMVVAGNDVYIAGYETSSSSPYNRLPKYWKNGVAVAFTSDAGTNSEVHRIVVNGTDVYGSGKENGKPVLWKNNNKTVLSNAEGWSYGLAVSGNDVYTAGAVSTGSNIYNATSWKNGAQTMLSNSTAQGVVSVYGIGVDGDDVYVIGSYPISNGSSPVYWKNGVINELPSTAGTNAYAYRLVIK